jgi:hypothetical protein
MKAKKTHKMKKHSHIKKEKNAIQTEANHLASPEAKKIIEKADSTLKSLESDDASLSDMLSLSKEIASGKTAEQEASDAKAKEEQIIEKQILAQQAKKEAEVKMD